jgi:hypothetical protein
MSREEEVGSEGEGRTQWEWECGSGFHGRRMRLLVMSGSTQVG